MASYAEYSAQTMASNDFTLYPDPESWNQEQSYLPTSTYAEQPYLSAATTFDSFPAQTTFAHQHYSDFRFDQTAEQAKDRFHSPAQSTSHSLDHHNPPQFSATSDSGHSTISSAMGSPSAQAQPSEWNHHLSLFPDIVQHSDSGVFAATSFEYETIPVTDKGCVGEFSNISSSQQLQSVVSPDVPRLSTAEAQSLAQTTFRSPTTPASATTSANAIERNRSSFSNATTSSTTQIHTIGRRIHTTTPSPFFSQSSGYFVPPLESSCPSSPTSRTISYSFSSYQHSYQWHDLVHQLTKRPRPIADTTILTI